MPEETRAPNGGGINFQGLAEHLVPAKWNSPQGIAAAIGLGIGGLALLYFGLPIVGTILSGAASTMAGLAGLTFQTIKFILGATAAVALGMFVTSKGFRTALKRTYLAAFFKYRRWQIVQDPVTMLKMAVDEQQAIYERGQQAVVRFQGSVQKQLTKIGELQEEYKQLLVRALMMKRQGNENQAILLTEKAQGIKDDVERYLIPDYHADASMAQKLDKAVQAAHLRVGRMRNTADRYASKMEGVQERRAARGELGAVLGESESQALFADSKLELERQFALDLAEGAQFDSGISGMVAEMDADRAITREKSLAFLNQLEAQGGMQGIESSISIPTAPQGNWTVPEELQNLNQQPGRAAARTR